MSPYERPASARHPKKYPCPVRDCSEELNSNDEVIIHLRAMHADALNRSLSRRLKMQTITPAQTKKRVNDSDGPSQPKKKRKVDHEDDAPESRSARSVSPDKGKRKADQDYVTPLSIVTAPASSSDCPAPVSKGKQKADQEYVTPLSTDTIPASSSGLRVTPLFPEDTRLRKKDEESLLCKFVYQQFQPGENGKVQTERKKKRYNPLERPDSSTSKKPVPVKSDQKTFKVVNGYYKEFIPYKPRQLNETDESSDELPHNAPVLGEHITHQAAEPQSLPHPSSVDANGDECKPVIQSHPSGNWISDGEPVLDEGVIHQAEEETQLPDVSTLPSWDQSYAYGGDLGFQNEESQQLHDEQPPSYVQESTFTSALPQAYTWDEHLNIPGAYFHQQIPPIVNPLGYDPMVNPSALNVQRVNPQAIQPVSQLNPTMPSSMISGCAAPLLNNFINVPVYPMQNQPMYSGMYPMQTMAGFTSNMLPMGTELLIDTTGEWDPALGDFVYKPWATIPPNIYGSGYPMDNGYTWDLGMNTMPASYSLPQSGLQNQQMPGTVPMPGESLLTESELLACERDLFGDPFTFCP